MSVLNKLKNNKKAVSPVVAAILLIGLVVVAGAAVAFIVLPMLNPSFTASNITFRNPNVSVTTGDYNNVTMTILFTNSFTADATLDDVTVFEHDGGTATSFSGFTATPITIPAGLGATITIFFIWVGDPMSTDESPTSMTLSFTSGSITVSVIITTF